MKRPTRSLALAFLFFIPLILLFQPPASAARRPNVIVILTEDQGWGDLSLNGNSNLTTPETFSYTHLTLPTKA